MRYCFLVIWVWLQVWISRYKGCALCLRCSDRKIRKHAELEIQYQYGVAEIDLIALPGIDGILARSDLPAITLIQNSATMLADKHSVKVIVMLAHLGCLGNPTDEEGHIACLHLSGKAIQACESYAPTVLWLVDADGKLIREISRETTVTIEHVQLPT